MEHWTVLLHACDSPPLFLLYFALILLPLFKIAWLTVARLSPFFVIIAHLRHNVASDTISPQKVEVFIGCAGRNVRQLQQDFNC